MTKNKNYMFGKINDAYDAVKNGLQLEVALATAEQKEKLAEAKLALAELKDYIAELKGENRILKETVAKKEQYVLDHSVYWLSTDVERLQPFCPSCMGKGLEMPMSGEGQRPRDTYYTCPNSDCHHSADPWQWGERQPSHVAEWRSF